MLLLLGNMPLKQHTCTHTHNVRMYVNTQCSLEESCKAVSNALFSVSQEALGSQLHFPILKVWAHRADTTTQCSHHTTTQCSHHSTNQCSPTAPTSAHTTPPTSAHTTPPPSAHTTVPPSTHTTAPTSAHTTAPTSAHTTAPLMKSSNNCV